MESGHSFDLQLQGDPLLLSDDLSDLIGQRQHVSTGGAASVDDESGVFLADLGAAYGQPLSVKDIAGRARQGDEQALRAFRLAGEALSELMEIIDRRFHPDKLALGGQIARSADLLHLNLPFPWEVSHHLDDAALRGAAYYALHSRAVLPKIQL